MDTCISLVDNIEEFNATILILEDNIDLITNTVNSKANESQIIELESALTYLELYTADIEALTHPSVQQALVNLSLPAIIKLRLPFRVTVKCKMK